MCISRVLISEGFWRAVFVSLLLCSVFFELACRCRCRVLLQGAVAGCRWWVPLQNFSSGCCCQSAVCDMKLGCWCHCRGGCESPMWWLGLIYRVVQRQRPIVHKFGLVGWRWKRGLPLLRGYPVLPFTWLARFLHSWVYCVSDVEVGRQMVPALHWPILRVLFQFIDMAPLYCVQLTGRAFSTYWFSLTFRLRLARFFDFDLT